MTKTRLSLAAALLALTACGGESTSGRNAASWTTTFDSTGDTIIARTSGEVPNDAERHLILEQQIGEAEGNDTVTFGRIEHIAVTSDGHMFVLDGQGPSLKLFDSTGTLVRFVGRKGGGPGEFEQVTGMGTLPNDKLALLDASHGRVNVYSSAGDYVAQWRAPLGGFFSSDGLHTDAAGDVILTLPIGADKGMGRMGQIGYVRFDSIGVVRDTIRIPRWIDSTPHLVATTERSIAMRYLPFAPRLTDTWSRAGALLSGPGAPYAIHVTHGRSRPLRIERAWTPVPVLPDEADDERAQLTWAMRTVDPAWNWSGPSIPSAKPAYDRLKSSDEGRIWVQLHATGERVETEEEPTSQPGQPRPPIRRFAEPNVYDVFEANGVYLGRVRADRSQDVLRMRGDRVWGVLTDSLGVAYVARWRVEPPF